MLTFQDFEQTGDRIKFISALLREHEAGELYKTARIADEYDARRNTTITQFVKVLYTASGRAVHDPTAANNRIASGFFPRLNTQRCAYSLGNGVSFASDQVHTPAQKSGPATKERLGLDFDTALSRAGYYALIHGVSFCLWNVDRMHVFPVTQFAPMWDETTGALRAGVRYWRVSPDKPMWAVLYEADGYTVYCTDDKGKELKEREAKRAYRQEYSRAAADAEPTLIAESNYGKLPIVPLWGSRQHQSTLIGMREAIDSYDLVRSGFANDLADCAQIYWLLENYGGMDNADLAQFRDRLKLQHIAVADTSQGGKVQAYAQQIPYEARQSFLSQIRSGIYEDYGALDVSSIVAGNKTATEINAAYQPLDENADDFEYQIISCMREILALIGIDDVPIFKRNRISNQMEQVRMIMLEAPYLDDATILKKLPNITADEVDAILSARMTGEQGRFVRENDTNSGGDDV